MLVHQTITAHTRVHQTCTARLVLPDVGAAVEHDAGALVRHAKLVGVARHRRHACVVGWVAGGLVVGGTKGNSN